ncbi:MAG TPA: RidA family protein [Thermoanaerobaculia bacterium]|nr:RidA family protein [Thermoanaerobaculia bacterium]
MDYVATDDAPKAIGPYSQAVISGGIVYTSGQIALDPASGNLIDETFEAQAHRVFRNLEAVLRAAGSDFSRVLRATVYLTDLANFQTLNTIYAQYFGDHKPARTTVGVAQLPKGSAVEIDLIATN